MGFSKETFEQYRREIRIMWRVLAVGAVIAGGAHFLSLPFISRLISVATGANEQEELTPIEIIVEEEVTQQVEEPEPEPPEEQPEPAASADRPSAAPQATNTEPVPLSDVAAANTVAVSPSIATENGVTGGEGAVGDSDAIGLVEGSGEPIPGNSINLPETSPPVEPPRPRQRVEETSLAARRQPSSRVVSCNPCSLPDFPNSARRNRSEGQPVINVIFDENGRVVEAEIEVSSGNDAFDQAALEEARQNWRFQDSQGTGGQVSVDVTYVVRDSDQYDEAQQAGSVLSVEIPAQQQVQRVTPDRAAEPVMDQAPRQAPSQPTSAPAATSPEPSAQPSPQPERSDNAPPAEAPAENIGEPAPANSAPANAISAPPVNPAPAPSSPTPAASPAPTPPPILPAPPSAPPPISPPPAAPTPEAPAESLPDPGQ